MKTTIKEQLDKIINSKALNDFIYLQPDEDGALLGVDKQGEYTFLPYHVNEYLSTLDKATIFSEVVDYLNNGVV